MLQCFDYVFENVFNDLLLADIRVESKENQWMGVTVHSQGPGGKIVVSLTVTIIL